MISKTRGIVLHRIKYSESSIIAKIYTEQSGLCSFLVQGARKKTSAVKANLLQPLSLIELVAYHKESTGLQKMKEMKNDHPLTSIQSNFAKTSIALFLSEILLRSIREESPNKPLFSFLHNSLVILDELENPANFHLLFLIKLTKFLGFFPHDFFPNPGSFIGEPHFAYQAVANGHSHDPKENTLFFNLSEGVFEKEKPCHPHFLDHDSATILRQLISMDFDALKFFSVDRRNRKILLEKIIDYYRLHLTGFQEIKSHQVLETVLRD